MLSTSPIPFYLLLVNGYLFIVMLVNQRQRQKGSWLIPNWQILVLGTVGGGIGGLLGQYFFKETLDKKGYRLCFLLGSLLGLFLLLSAFD